MALDLKILEGKRCCIYCRVSTEHEEQTRAIVDQIAESKERAVALKMTVVREYIDNGITGTSIKHRDAFKQLQKDIIDELWDVCVFKDDSRLMRNTTDWFSFVDEMDHSNKTIYIWLDNKIYDYESDEDRMIYGMKSMISEGYSRSLSKKMKAYNRRRQLQGKFNFNRPMYGWNIVDRQTLSINEEEAQYLRMAVDLVIDGWGFQRIAKYMASLGAKSPTGTEMYPASWKRMLFDEKMYGCVVFGKKGKTLGNTYNKPDNEWIKHENAIPAIITEEKYNEMKDAYESRTSTGKKVPYCRYPLSGKIKCGICGESYHRHMQKRKVQVAGKQYKEYVAVCWVCRRAYRFEKTSRPDERTLGIGCKNYNVQENRLMELLSETSEKLFGNIFESSDNIIDSMMNMVEKILSSDIGTRKLGTLRQKVASNKKKIDVLFDKLMDQVIEDSDFKTRKEKLENEIRVYEEEINTIERNSANLMINQQRLEQIKASIINEDLVKKAESIGLLEFVNNIIVNWDDVSLTFVYNKDRIMEFIGLVNFDGLDITDEDTTYKVTVQYCGWEARWRETAVQKKALMDLIKKDGSLSYSQMAAEMGLTSKIVRARLKRLIDNHYVERTDTGELRILKEWDY